MTCTYSAPSAEDKFLKILVADGSVERGNGFRISGSGYWVKVVNSAGELERYLLHEKNPTSWDLLLHSIYLGDWKAEKLSTVPMVVEAFRRGKLKGVVCTSTISTDGEPFVKALREQGVPSCYIPFLYQSPSTHREVPVDFPLQVGA